MEQYKDKRSKNTVAVQCHYTSVTDWTHDVNATKLVHEFDYYTHRMFIHLIEP